MIWACRWANGDVSFVDADNEKAARALLDEAGDPAMAEITQVPPGLFSIHLELQRDGYFATAEGLGEECEHWVIEHCYPLLEAYLRLDESDVCVSDIVEQEYHRLECPGPGLK